MVPEDALMVVLVGGGIVVVLSWATWRIVRGWASRALAARDPIDTLIAQNRAKPRAGMAKVNWLAIERAGERRWREVLRAQRRVRHAPTVANQRGRAMTPMPSSPLGVESKSLGSRLLN